MKITSNAIFFLFRVTQTIHCYIVKPLDFDMAALYLLPALRSNEINMLFMRESPQQEWVTVRPTVVERFSTFSADIGKNHIKRNRRPFQSASIILLQIIRFCVDIFKSPK